MHQSQRLIARYNNLRTRSWLARFRGHKVKPRRCQSFTTSRTSSIAARAQDRQRASSESGRGLPSGGGLCWTKVGTRRVPEDTRPREEAWSPLLGAGVFFVPRYGPGNVIQWGWSKGKTSKIMIKGGARGVIWLVEISPAFGVTTRGRRGGCPLSPLSSSLISVSRPDARPLSVLSLSTASLSPSSVSLYLRRAALLVPFLAHARYPLYILLFLLFLRPVCRSTYTHIHIQRRYFILLSP